ncbi:MAG: DUF411 domain-containing protein [Gemmatimonadaceae bacterium]|nr:DUF411 domain-containing protein [Gemmatimonadaceae bacterium]
MMRRREFLSTLAACAVLPRALRAASAATTMTVYKDANCGCCKAWVALAQKAGYAVKSLDVTDLDATKRQLGIPAALASCHSVVCGKYLFEGHVPLDLIARVLREQPKIVGLAVPGMPAGSPGMEVGRKDPFDVIAWDARGTRVYAKR